MPAGRPKNSNWKKSTFPDLVVDVWVNLAKFYSRQYTSPHGCTYMTGPRHNQGYPMIGGRRKSDESRLMMTCHRLAYKIAHGDPGSAQVLHTCSDMCCVNPDHLVLGDTQTRVDICVSAGRQSNGSATRKRGEPKRQQNRQYKYTEEEIRWVRDPRTTTDMIAKKYGITKAKAASRKWSWSTEAYLWLKA